MPTVKEADLKRHKYAWMMKCLMEEKEREANARLLELQQRQPSLKRTYEQYLKLYDLHIKPLMEEVKEFTDNQFEMRELEHFLQDQEARRMAYEAGKVIKSMTAKPTKPQYNLQQLAAADNLYAKFIGGGK